MKYKRFGNTGLRVSELCLGTMTFGSDWGWGADKDTCAEMVRVFLEAGGNFIDTANYYTNGSSEKILGEILEKRRQEMVLSTKYSLMTNRLDINSGGNQRKNMMQSVEQSLKNLKTDYLDIYWVHIIDKYTPMDEVLRGLDDLVRSGKILYTGISDAPAWTIAKANAIASERNWTSFHGIQAKYNLIDRSAERELISMADQEKLSILAWSPLSGGLLSGKYNSSSKADLKGSRLEKSKKVNNKNLKIADTIIKIAKEMNVTPANVALAWIKRNPTVIPIIGSRKVAQLQDNLQCVDVLFSNDNLVQLEQASALKLGFPHDFIADQGVQDLVYGDFKINN